MGRHKGSKDKNPRKYWYFIHTWECVLCGRYEEYRERRYTSRPEDYHKRHDRNEYACGEHFI